MRTQKIYFIVGILTALGLSRCGTQICTMGMGDCAQMFHVMSATATPSPSALALQMTGPSIVTYPQPARYAATGGNGNYTYSVVTPIGCGQFGPTLGYFTPAGRGNCTIQVTDTSNPPLTATATIQIR